MVDTTSPFTLPSILAIASGMLLTALTLQDAFEVMLLPRRVKRRMRFVRIYFEGAWRIWTGMAKRSSSDTQSERFLSLFGPLSIMVLFAIWTLGVLIGFALMYWGAEQGGPDQHSFADYLNLSGSNLLTLGSSHVKPNAGLSKALSIVEAAAGFSLLAVVIGYLPVLYQLFSQREARVIQLDVRAGSPPSAAVLLTRHASDQAIEKLDELLHDWEKWCAELVESHLSYPMLSFYRSQHPNQNWLAALTAITDCCVVIMVGLKGVPTFQAKMTFSMARLAAVELSRVFDIDPKRRTIDRLQSNGFRELEESLRKAGLEWSGDPDPEATLTAFRATYEPFLVNLADYLQIDVPCFVASGPTAQPLDNWQRSLLGRSAADLVRQSPEG